MSKYVEADAELSDDEVYRYRLWRVWDPTRPSVTWIMLNPSTADGRADDPTVVRCVEFARRWGYGRVYVLNLFAFRATEPRELRRHAREHGVSSAVGPQTDERILGHLAAHGPMVSHPHGDPPRPNGNILVCAWGANGAKTERARHVLQMMNEAGAIMHRVGDWTREKQPRHPLFLRQTEVPVPFVIDT